MKRVRLYFVLMLLFGGAAAYLYIFHGQTGTIKNHLKSFAVEDTASIDKIVIISKTGDILKLEKKNASWIANDSVNTRKDMIDILLQTIMRVEVKAPVNKNMKDNVMKQMISGSLQVQIYTNGSLKKKYYVGSHTSDGTGTFMMLDGASEPFINHIPGFEGYLTTRYTTNVAVWTDRELFRYSPDRINLIKVHYNNLPDKSFVLRIGGQRDIVLMNERGDTATSGFNMQFLRDFISSFSDVQYENVLNTKKVSVDELLIPNNHLVTISVYDKDGKSRSLELFKRYYDGEKFIPTGHEVYFDPDRVFVRMDNKRVFNGQYKVFNELIVTYDDFFSKQEK